MRSRSGLSRVGEAIGSAVGAGEAGLSLLAAENAIVAVDAGRVLRDARAHAVAVMRQRDVVVAPVEDSSGSARIACRRRTGVATAPGGEGAEGADAGALGVQSLLSRPSERTAKQSYHE